MDSTGFESTMLTTKAKLPLDPVSLCTLCHPIEDEYGTGSVCNDLHLYYLIGGIVTIVCALFVIISYLFMASLRRHPSILIFMRCCADLLFGVCLVITTNIPIDRMFCAALHNEHISPCRVLGPLMMFAFQCSIYFFSASLFDLYKSLKNPFAKPHAGTKRLIFLVLFVSLMLTLSIEYVFDSKHVAFAYRADIQLCWIRPISYDTVNPINAVFVFTPVGIISSGSMAMNIYAFLRLRQGLPDTFAIRMRSVRDSFAYSVGFTLYFIPLGVTYFLIWSQDRNAHSVPALLAEHSSSVHAAFALLFGCFGFMSAFLWWLRKLRRRDVQRLYQARLDKMAALALDPSDEFLNERQVRKSITQRIKMEKLQQTVTRKSSNKNTGTRPLSDLHESILVPERPAKLYKHKFWRNSINFGIYARHTDEEERRSRRSWCQSLWSEFSFRANNKDDSNINKALRREVLAYTTDGIAQSIDHACKLNEVKQKEYVEQLRTTIESYSAMMGADNDAGFELDEEQLFAMILVHIPAHLDEEDSAKIHRFGIYIQYNCALLYKDNRSNIVSDSQVISLFNCCGSRLDDRQFAVNPASYHEPSLNRVTTLQVQQLYTKMGKERQFVDYAPLVFRYIRTRLLQISDAEYRHSIIPSSEEQQREVLDAKFGDGKSGAFFYFTHNSRFIVKTIKKREMQVFLQTLPDYVRYLRRNPHTILSRCVGLHSMRMYGLRKYFMVMENVFLAELQPHEIFDLKGSWVGRSTDHGVQSGKVMKDNDLKRFVILNSENRNQIIEQLERDTMFLEQHQIMDYSLLLGVYHMKICTNNQNNTSRTSMDIANGAGYHEEEEEKHLSDIEMESSKASKHSIHSVQSAHSNASRSGVNTYAGGVQAQVIEAPGIYYLGIIDALQKYTFRKKLETFVKRMVSGEDGDGISCVDPTRYRQRFMNYMRHIIIKDVQFFQERNLEISTDFKPQTVLVYPAKDVIDDNMEALRTRKHTLPLNHLNDAEDSFEQYQAMETEDAYQ